MTTISAELEQQVLEIIRKHPEVIAEVLQTYEQQQQQARQQKFLAFLDTFNDNPESIIGTSPSTGASDPKVWLIEFSDFQSPSGRDSYDTIREFMESHQDEVQLVYKYFPFTQQHPEAENAAKAAWAAHQQGEFWPYRDGLFSQQDRLGDRFYQELAEALDLDLDRFNYDQRSASSDIEQDRELGDRLGMTGTPFVVMFAPGQPQGKGEIFDGAIVPEKIEEMFQNVSG
ncbi:DsbA family protein [Roseofilum casamattae]|uniref:Thioredoxin domain-containing protein n=1 Tax=Roseofilum casamattae BLCC-M143 TaxID=3022442 RepID=A0ABT7BTT4_9CYAN|nr:thioredoxin domain-containing protein [Roseofilum casamattae]MDJ1182591.1 thioredoxin domain-containing protein [Roseofilum casamattae BLCC-M143]